jgi:hypothetical protein
MANYELYHHGIKGMRWGVRRYQNKDGTLTAAGKKRMYREHFDLEGKDPNEKKKYVADANKWVKEDTERTKRLVDSSTNLSRELKRANENSIKRQPKERLDLSEISDKELRERINRELLERQYNDVFNPPQISKGKEYTSKILDVSTDVLAVTGSALTVALGIRALMKGD